jgi:hypothetical protein
VTEEQSGESTEQDGDGQRLNRAPRVIGIIALACYAVMPVAGALAWSTAVLVAVVSSQVMDQLVVANLYVRAAFARGQFGIASRTLAREAAVIVLVYSASWASYDQVRVVGLGLVLVAALRLIYQLLLVLARQRSLPLVEILNLDVPGVTPPPNLPEMMRARLSERLHGVSAVACVGAVVAVLISSPTLGIVVVGLVVAFEVLAVLIALGWLLRSRGMTPRDRYFAAVHAYLITLDPEVMLYHTGTIESIHQVNMWLGAAEGVRRPAIVALRERNYLPMLAPTTLPVICIPGSVDFMGFTLPSVRVALYTANVGKTIHMLREPGVRHVFVGHGDSDKTASFNPFSRAYSEVWVAGPAGRDRYRRAAVGVRDEDIVEVGRPQLNEIAVMSESIGDRELTVLYAPTWEGWTGDPAHTSLLRTGVGLVERLVALPNVRVIYKPHPFTGTVLTSAIETDLAIRAMLTKASDRHQVVVGPDRSLYDCFNHSDLMVADISSVLSDFISSEKPYVVPNLTGLDDDAFRELFPSTREAYLLDPAGEQIEAILDLVRSSDPLAARRRDLKHYLLGPDEPDAMTRFAAAVDAAYDRAVEQNPIRVAAGFET